MANIYVGVLIVRLELPWISSLKEKRALITPITEKLKSRFPLSVARLDGTEAYNWEVIGVSAIAHDKLWLEQLLSKAANFIATSPCTVTSESLEVEVWAHTEEY